MENIVQTTLLSAALLTLNDSGKLTDRAESKFSFVRTRILSFVHLFIFLSFGNISKFSANRCSKTLVNYSIFFSDKCILKLYIEKKNIKNVIKL